MGKPCIRSMHFPVVTLVGYLADGMTTEEILQDFPFLEEDDITQALGFSAMIMDKN